MNVETAPTATGVSDAAGYVERLGRLRTWAGRPSFRRLMALAGTTVTSDEHVVDRLPPSTVSDVLAGKRLPQLPRMELVGAFVEACMRACEIPPPVIAKVVEEWLTEWRRLAGLTPQVDERRSDGMSESADVPVRTGVEAERGNDRPLVGRSDALREIEQALDEIADGRSQFIAMVAEPGTGKTRLLGELAAIAAHRELVTLWGRSGEFEQEMPLGMVVDALDDYLEGRGEWVRQHLGAERSGYLSTVLPSLSMTPENNFHAESDGLARYRVYRAVRRLLEELAVPSGVVMILDDVHWADTASVELVDHLLRHPPRGRVLLAVAYRPAQVAPQLTTLIESGFDHVRQISVNPFTLAEVEEFLGLSAGRAWCRKMHAASGGNAFYLEALARMGRREPLTVAHVDLDAVGELPRAVRAALEVELRNLSPAALLVANAAAVVANEFEPSVVAVAAEMDDDVVLAGLDKMSARDIIRLTASGGRFRFRHPLIRSVAYDLAAPGWRLAAHARVAAHLADAGAPVTAQARHVARSAGFGDHAAVTTLIEAARAVAGHAPAAAAHWVSAALRLLPADSDPPAFRLDLLLELARLQVLTGRWPAGHETVREVLQLTPSDDNVRRARAIRFAALVERHLDHPDKATLLLTDELRRLPDPRSPLAAPLRLRLAAESLLRSDYRAARATLDLLPDSGEVRDTGLLLAIAAMRPLPALAGLRIADAIRHVEAAGQMETAASDEHLAEYLDSIVWLYWTETLMGRHRSAQHRFKRAVAVARASGHFVVGILLAGQARTHAMLGQLASAAMVAEEAAEEARLLNLVLPLVIALSQQCLVASWSGDDKSALRFGDQAVHASLSGEWQGSLAYYAKAVALINVGRLDEGAETLSRAWFSKHQLDPLTQLSCCELMAQVETGRGRNDEAVTWAKRADHLTHPDLEITLGLARLAWAHALRTMAPAAAAEHARQAAVALTAADLPIEAGRARLLAAITYADLGEIGPAREHLRQATQIFAACGAYALHAQAVGQQHRVG